MTGCSPALSVSPWCKTSGQKPGVSADLVDAGRLEWNGVLARVAGDGRLPSFPFGRLR